MMKKPSSVMSTLVKWNRRLAVAVGVFVLVLNVLHDVAIFDTLHHFLPRAPSPHSFSASSFLLQVDAASSNVEIHDNSTSIVDPASLKKTHELRKNLGKSSDHLVRFTDTSYRNWILKSPRQYYVVLLFTVAEGCELCKRLEVYFKEAAESFYMSGEHEESASRLPVFFGKVEVSQNEKAFLLHGLHTAPHLVVTEPKSFKKVAKDGTLPLKREDTFRFDPQSSTTREVLMNFINRKTKRTVKVYESPQKKMAKLMGGITLLSVLVFAGGLIWRIVLSFPLLIALGALSVQYLSTSGLFYNLSHGMQLFGYEGGQIQRISKSNRSQYLGEGLMMSGCIVASGMALYAAASAPLVHKIKQKRISDIATLAFATIFVGLVYLAYDIYIWKTGWYAPSFFPPSDYIRGPLRSDQGNSF